MSTWLWLLVVYVAYVVGFGVGKYEKQIEALFSALGLTDHWTDHEPKGPA